MEVKILDKDIKLVSLKVSQHGEHVKLLKLEIANEVKSHMTGLPLDVCTYIWDKLRNEVKSCELGTATYRLECLKLRGLGLALWILAKAVDANITLDDCLAVLENDFDKLSQAILYDVLGFTRPATK